MQRLLQFILLYITHPRCRRATHLGSRKCQRQIKISCLIKASSTGRRVYGGCVQDLKIRFDHLEDDLTAWQDSTRQPYCKRLMPTEVQRLS
ncbi:hypothetical protein BJ508DRAFT_41993 [Ascobolus immersus RN42]|uniref:Uncharacterized protein n=1 Tax=Ascobolus immersus RN42 TaxID=1160509 RepID=A0A3N4IEZ1_ASCIM|nr:hypothetical protein BJ508DRAFT_41993 [Ascobolus immersus RN42]